MRSEAPGWTNISLSYFWYVMPGRWTFSNFCKVWSLGFFSVSFRSRRHDKTSRISHIHFKWHIKQLLRTPLVIIFQILSFMISDSFGAFMSRDERNICTQTLRRRDGITLRRWKSRRTSQRGKRNRRDSQRLTSGLVHTYVGTVL